MNDKYEYLPLETEDKPKFKIGDVLTNNETIKDVSVRKFTQEFMLDLKIGAEEPAEECGTKAHEQMEKTMNKITIELPASAVVQAAKEAKVKTELETSKKVIGTIYNAAGIKYDRMEYKSVKAAKQALQQPQFLGMTMRIYVLENVITTNIPLVSTMKKAKAAKK